MAQVKTCDLVETEQKPPEGETGGAQEGVSVPTLRRAVHRARILRDIKLRANEVSATIVIAPDGFGKTTLLCQRVAEVQRDSSRGTRRSCGKDALASSEGLRILAGVPSRQSRICERYGRCL